MKQFFLMLMLVSLFFNLSLFLSLLDGQLLYIWEKVWTFFEQMMFV